MTRTLDEESNSPLRNLNEEQFVSLGHSFDQRKRGKERREKIRERRGWRRVTIVIHCSRDRSRWQPIPKIEFTRSKTGRVCWIAKLSARDVSKKAETGCAFALGHIEASPTPFSLPAVGRVPWTNFEGRDTANKPARREGTPRAEGREVWKLSVSWLPSNRFACFSRKWDKRR